MYRRAKELNFSKEYINGELMSDIKQLFPLSMQRHINRQRERAITLRDLLRHFSLEIESIEQIFAENSRQKPRTLKQMSTSNNHSSQKNSETNKYATRECPLCRTDDHTLSGCQLSYQEMRETANDLGLCFRCFNQGHSARECRKMIKCKYCGQEHYSFLCSRIKEWEASQSQQINKPNSGNKKDDDPSAGTGGSSRNNLASSYGLQRWNGSNRGNNRENAQSTGQASGSQSWNNSNGYCAH